MNNWYHSDEIPFPTSHSLHLQTAPGLIPRICEVWVYVESKLIFYYMHPLIMITAYITCSCSVQTVYLYTLHPEDYIAYV